MQPIIKRFYCFKCKTITPWTKAPANYPYYCMICSLKAANHRHNHRPPDTTPGMEVKK